jgi:glycosyltransferase involved in cell wall biosynthesis
MDPTISFILPCFNVALYVGRCIESIERQDIPLESYEIICVDDCSTDDTRGVIKEYQTRYDNILLYCHKHNKNAGGARNTGLSFAKGKYIWFVDPDDCIIPNVLSRLCSVADERNTEMLLFNLQLTSENGALKLSSKYQDINRCVSGVDFVSLYCDNQGLYEVASHVSCIFRRSFLQRNLLFYPVIRSSQDVVFIWNSVLAVSHLSSISDICYHVFRRPMSTTGSIGKISPESIISASLLYSVELINLAEKYHEIVPIKIINTLYYDAKLSVNNDSRTVFQLGRQDLIVFYRMMSSFSEHIDRVRNLMNRKTRVLFNYRLPMYLWYIEMSCYKWHGRLFKHST